MSSTMSANEPLCMPESERDSFQASLYTAAFLVKKGQVSFGMEPLISGPWSIETAIGKCSLFPTFSDRLRLLQAYQYCMSFVL